MTALADLAYLVRAPRAGVARVLARPHIALAIGLLVFATLTSTLVAARIGSEIDVNALFFAGTREPVVQALIDAIGPQRTAVILYLVQQSFDAVIVATAFTPIFFWVLGSSAVHVAARAAGGRALYLPLLILFGYASALAVVPGNVATLALGVGKGVGPSIASVVGYLGVLWLLFIAFRAVERHYGVSGERAVRILVVAVVLFYLAPLVLIIVAAISIVVAAVVLEYF